MMFAEGSTPPSMKRRSVRRLMRMFQSLYAEEFEETVVVNPDHILGARRPAKLQTRYVPKVTGKNVRRFGQNRGHY